MSIKRTLLALGVLAATMLVGCKQPLGLRNNDVHVASICTTYCFVGDVSSPTGYVSKYVDGQTPNGWYTLTPDSIIERYLDEVRGYVYPKRYGYCYFSVPHFESPGAVPVCTLFYKQKSHTGSLNLIFNWVSNPGSWVPPAETLWKAIDTSSFPLASAQSVQNDGWCKLALSPGGGGIIADIAEAANGGPLVTGWKFNNAIAGWVTDVYGTTDEAVAPYIKVVYDPNP